MQYLSLPQGCTVSIKMNYAWACLNMFLILLKDYLRFLLFYIILIKRIRFIYVFDDN